MKTNTRKYKIKNRNTRRGGSNTQVKAPEAKVESIAAPEQKSFWGSIFGSASKPGDKIIKAADELIKLIKEKNISSDLKLEQIKSEAAKLQ